jgi:hypothetical protein
MTLSQPFVTLSEVEVPPTEFNSVEITLHIMRVVTFYERLVVFVK